MERLDLPKVTRVKSQSTVDELEAFDMMSRFLASEKAKQLSEDFTGQMYLTSSSQTWNDLRMACNSLLEDNDTRREPVAEWKDESGLHASMESSPRVKEEDAMVDTPATENSEKEAKSSSKEEKRAAKKAKKEAKKAKKEMKKAKKEAKKRKRSLEA